MVKYFIFIGLVVMVFIVACQSDTPVKRSLNPNGDSELALLMRKMFDETMKMKEAKEKGGKFSPTFDLEEILTAHPTEKGKNTSSEYKAYAQLYMNMMKDYEHVSSQELYSAYDNVVNSCKACHQALCPGPLRRIVHLE